MFECGGCVVRNGYVFLMPFQYGRAEEIFELIFCVRSGCFGFHFIEDKIRLMNESEINDFIYFLKDEIPQTEIELSAWYIMKHPKANIPQMIIELKRIDLLDENNNRISLKEIVKQQLNNLPSGFENLPYEYFKLRHEEKIKAENATKWYNAQDAKRRYEDYPRLKKRAATLFIITIILGILSLAEAIKIFAG